MAETIVIQVQFDDGSVRKGFATVQEQGEQTAKKIQSSFSPVTRDILKLSAAYFSLRAVKGIFSDAIRAAQDQEDAINKLNTSLRLAGSFSQQASLDFQNLANEIQKTTVIEDDQVLALASLARNFSRTNEEAQKLTKAAIDLASATGIDAESAVGALGGSLSGITGQLTKVLPQIRGLTEEQLKAGAAIDFVAKRFAGAAAGEINTFSGQTKQLSNLFKDLLQEIGGLITNSPAVVAVFKVVGQSVLSLISTLSAFSASGDIFKPIITGLAAFAQAINTLFVIPIEVAFNLVKVSFQGLALVIQGFVAGFFKAIDFMAQKIAPDSEFSQNINALKESTSLAFSDIATNAANAGNEIFTNLNISSSVDSFLEDIGVAAAASAPAFDTIKASAANAQEGVRQLGEETKKLSVNLTEVLKEAVRRVASEALPALFTAVIKGRNAFKAFGSAIFGILGDIAIQTGTTLVLIGSGIEALRASILGLTGGPALAAGIALIALGSLLKSLSGGAGEASGASTGGAGGGGGFASTDQIASPEDELDDRQKSQVVVNVQGDVLDSRDTGLRIVDLINEAFDTQGAVVTARV
jgi:hypothetical protein